MAVLIVAGFGATASATPGGSNGSQAQRDLRTIKALAAKQVGKQAGKQAGKHVRKLDDASGPIGELPPRSAAAIVGAVGLATSARSTRSKVNILIPPVYTVVYAFVNTRSPVDPVRNSFPAPKGLLPARPNPACNYYVAEIPNNLYSMNLYQPDGAVPGKIRSVGHFPDTKVSLLAFGILPVTAVLHARQILGSDGKLDPLTADAVDTPYSIRKDDPAGAAGKAGCDADWEANMPKPVISTGQVEASISDVRVDGEPVPVGDSCRTETPLQLHLIGEDQAHGGNYSGIIAGGELIQRRDTSTTKTENPIALYPDSRNLTIPPFVGCRGAAGEDVSKLITGMVSGPDNTVSVNQAEVSIISLDLNAPSVCQTFDPTQCAVLPKNLTPPNPGK